MYYWVSAVRPSSTLVSQDCIIINMCMQIYVEILGGDVKWPFFF